MLHPTLFGVKEYLCNRWYNRVESDTSVWRDTPYISKIRVISSLVVQYIYLSFPKYYTLFIVYDRMTHELARRQRFF